MFYQDNGTYTGPALNFQNNNTVHAELSLFSKIFTPDFARRPMIYNFGGEFRHELSDRLASVGTLGGYNRENSKFGWKPNNGYFGKDRCAASIVLPSVKADAVHMSTFCEVWSFILVITTVRNSPGFTAIPPMVTKEVFSGYVNDDPISRVLMSGNKSDITNKNAILVTTHHTSYNISDNIVNTIAVDNDKDIIPQQIAANIQSDGAALASLRPDRLAQGIVAGGMFDTSIMTTPVPLNQNTNTAEEVDTAYSLPTAHVTKLVNGLANSIGNTDFTRCTGAGDAMTELTSNLSSQLAPGYSSMISFDANRQAIRPDRPFTIGDLDAAFPGDSLLVLINTQPQGQQVDLLDPLLPTPQNQMSSLISMCLPPLLIEHGFSEIQFRYCSYDVSGDGINKGSYQIQSANTLCELTPEMYHAKVSALMTDIINDIFMIIVANVGEFNVCVNCGVGGVTLVDLTLTDWASQNQNGYSFTNNRLGGLNSSLIGTEKVSSSNQQQLSGIIQDCVNTSMAGIVQYDQNDVF